MSKLSQLIRRYRETFLVESVVQYLTQIDLPGPVKKSVAMAVVKLLHTKTGGKWDKKIEEAVSGAIEWVLAEIREDAVEMREDKPSKPAEPTTPEPQERDNYGIWNGGDLPSDEILLDTGFRTGDMKYTDELQKFWMVTRPGDVVPMSGALLPVLVGSIGE
jgi:hypothetical protein